MELDTKEAGLAVDLFWSWKVRVVCGGCGSSRLLLRRRKALASAFQDNASGPAGPVEMSFEGDGS